MRIARATSARTAQSAPTRDFNLRSVNQPLEERYFERRQIREAIAFAEAGGIAIHRNFDYYHVIGLRTLLEEWGRHHGLRPEWIQPEKRRKVAHYDVFGPSAELLIARVSGTNPDKAP